MTDDSYHMHVCIGIGIGISIGKIFSSVLSIESIGKKWYRSTFNVCVVLILFILSVMFKSQNCTLLISNLLSCPLCINVNTKVNNGVIKIRS